jgi:NADPH:quinone reductase-like Zn-dependent oxidoreductase
MGTLTEFVVTDQDAIVHVPEHLSFHEAATLPCAGVTAWNALAGTRPPLPGETVLTLGSGGVSLFAVGFAKAFGARVIAITSSDDKAERLIALGADEVINYGATTDWDRAIRELTGGRGVDHVIEVGVPERSKSLSSRLRSMDKLPLSVGLPIKLRLSTSGLSPAVSPLCAALRLAIGRISSL